MERKRRDRAGGVNEHVFTDGDEVVLGERRSFADCEFAKIGGSGH